MNKVCTGCHRSLPATKQYFYAAKKGKYGLTAICKDCQREYKRQYQKEKAEEISRKNREYYLKNKERCLRVRSEWRKNNPNYFKDWSEENKEYKEQYDKEYYEKNKEKINQYKHEWYIENREKVIPRTVEYKRNNKEKVRTWENKRRTMKAKLDHSLTSDEWVMIKEEFNHKCAYCGKEKDLTQEHFIPISKGGEFTINNIIPACISCNCSKNNKDFDEWYPTYKYYSKQRENKILKHLNYESNKTQQLSIL